MKLILIVGWFATLLVSWKGAEIILKKAGLLGGLDTLRKGEK